jgi:hypothetical protein
VIRNQDSSGCYSGIVLKVGKVLSAKVGHATDRSPIIYEACGAIEYRAMAVMCTV